MDGSREKVEDNTPSSNEIPDPVPDVGKLFKAEVIKLLEKAGFADGSDYEYVDNIIRPGDEAESTDHKDEVGKCIQLKEKQFQFLKKHFDEIRAFQLIRNWNKIRGLKRRSKPVELENIPCECDLEYEYLISVGKTTGAKKQRRAESAASATAPPPADPFIGHNVFCNVHRLNTFFRKTAALFNLKNCSEEMFLPDLERPPKYYRLANREVRKVARLKLEEGLMGYLEDWEEDMSDREFEEAQLRNKSREFLVFVLDSMLESLMGSSSDEDDEDSDDEPAHHPKEQPSTIKLTYRWFKRRRENMERKLKNFHKLQRWALQTLVLDGNYQYAMKASRPFRIELRNDLAVDSNEECLESEDSEHEIEKDGGDGEGGQKGPETKEQV